MTREGAGVWQVAAGFEADEEVIRDAIRMRRLRIPRDGEGLAGGGPRGRDPAGAAGTAAAGPPAEPPPSEDSPPAADPPPAEMLPPPGNTGGVESPLAAVRAPTARQQTPPSFPEEAGRARLIGEARVQMLVDVNAAGVPVGSRMLRGPDPDLGMRQAALTAVGRWRFEPARFEGRPVRYFAPIEITFTGLPPESRLWSHRALFEMQALLYEDEAKAQAAAARLRAGTPVEEVSPESALDSEWGLTAAAGLPAPVRAALHEATIGLWAGPVAAEGRYWLARKRGEVYFGVLPQAAPGDLQYQVVHQRGVPDSDELRRALDADVLDFAAERKRRDYMNEAARLMGLRQARAEVGQMVIRTDVLNDDEMRLLGSIVTATLRAHQEFWAGLTTLRLFRRQVMVYAFANKSDHQKVQATWLGRPGATAAASGEYIPASRILAFPCETTGGHLPIPVMVHEAIHMLDYERVYPPRVQPSKWFEEGLANYFGLSQIDSQLRIDPGSIRRSGTIVAGNVKVQFDPRLELLGHRRLSRERGPIALADLLAAGPGDPLWTGEQSARSYGASWTLVHFLLHGERGRRAEAFRQYAAQEARGEGGLGTFRRIFGGDLAALETAWHEYEEAL
jgi:TonB family protein